MPAKAPIQPLPPAITIADVYYVLFKHKWKIFICAMLGFVGAALIYFLSIPPYVSEAKLLVAGMPNTKAVGSTSQPLQLAADAIMISEADILTSLDVAGAAVENVGVEKVLGKNAATTNKQAAALLVRKQITVDVPQRGNVLRVVVKDKNPEIAQQLLREVIAAYLKQHSDAHQKLSVDDVLSRQTDDAKSRLAATEESLRKVKEEAGITSLEDAKRQVAERLAKVTEDLRTAQVELEERRASLAELQKAALVEASGAAADTNAAPLVAKPKEKASPELVAEYQRVLARLESFRKREQELMQNFRLESPLVKEARQNVEGVEKEKRDMIAANPILAEEEPATGTGAVAAQKRDTKAAEIMTENGRIAALTAKIKILQSQLALGRQDVTKLDKIESDMVPLERKKALEDANYRYYQTTLEQARFDTTLSGGQSSNIKEIQAPSLPYREKAPIIKQVVMVAMGGLAVGFGLAFMLEFLLDQSVRKPAEVEQKYRLPAFLTIPDLNGAVHVNGYKQLSGGAALKALPAATEATLAATTAEVPPRASADIAPWDEKHQLHPYSAALRDRLVSFFELKGLTHKPKLVALTSCSRGAGVTTVAAGLAASLSETGEGNVLLVDMNIDQAAAHPFYRGKPACGLADVLEQDKRPAAMVQEKLYMVHGGSADDRLPQILPKRISHLIPKLQASDYDYIIFDMPPITQTSVTPRLAAFMDMVFVVVEDEKTSREWLKQASALLHESKANLGAVYNKRRTYVPKWLHQEF